MFTLLIDGDNLLTIGFHGYKNLFFKGYHIGGIFHFLSTIGRLLESYHIEKVCVFWDGENGSSQRRKFYPKYKDKSKKTPWSVEERNNYNYQKGRIKQYLEELYVRQGEFPNCESDDCIAYYVSKSQHEKKIIYSSDRDLLQLVDENTSLFNPSHGIMYNPGDIISYDHQNVIIENVKIIKMICGDPSDNIDGIRGLGIKTLLKHFPEMEKEPIKLETIIEKTNLLVKDNEKSGTLKNLINGITKEGILGEEFFKINFKIIDLNEPFINDEVKEEINNLIFEVMDIEGRSYKNTMRMMTEDGVFEALPKHDGWLKFLTPYLKLTMKEKNKTIKKNNYAKSRT